MITMGILKKWVNDTLSADATFSALCTATVDSPLNYYRGTPINKVVETLPFFTSFTDEANLDFNSGMEYPKNWSVPCALAIKGVDSDEMPVAPVTDGTSEVYELTDDAELLALTAVEILRKKAVQCGINGENVILMSARVIVSQIGEADDVQANIFLVFGLGNYI